MHRSAGDRMGVVLVAYSGGYDPAPYALAVGGAGARVRGVILLDALYGEIDKFDKWIGTSVAGDRSGFFFSAYSDSSRAQNLALQHSLAEQGIKIDIAPHPPRLSPGTVTFLFAGSSIDHKRFVTNAWMRDPQGEVTRLRLLLDQRPDAVPVDTWGSDAELCDAVEEYLARRIAGINGETALKTGARFLPSLAPIGVEGLDIRVT
jgi:hypothetical protein